MYEVSRCFFIGVIKIRGVLGSVGWYSCFSRCWVGSACWNVLTFRFL